MKQIPLYRHIENITGKNLEQVTLKPFIDINKRKFYNLAIASYNNHASSCNTIVLTEKQKQQFEKLFGRQIK